MPVQFVSQVKACGNSVPGSGSPQSPCATGSGDGPQAVIVAGPGDGGGKEIAGGGGEEIVSADFSVISAEAAGGSSGGFGRDNDPGTIDEIVRFVTGKDPRTIDEVVIGLLDAGGVGETFFETTGVGAVGAGACGRIDDSMVEMPLLTVWATELAVWVSHPSSPPPDAALAATGFASIAISARHGTRVFVI